VLEPQPRKTKRDWRVAKAYIALADDPEEMEIFDSKRKESSSFSPGKDNGHSGPSSRLEVMAVERYLDDEEWEAQERMEGRSVKIAPFPYSADEKMRANDNLLGRSWWKTKKG